ncbi:MAG TPA: hypothetical protein DG754_04470 [Bacteroidales bacterium]|jgi:hypothetical protein|nr:hypothetical protein [Bacteroidales bacterium]
MELNFWLYALLVVAGFAAGFINTLAGSGSLLTLPLLIFMGLPANVANGTNRIGVLLQSLVATRQFKKKKIFEWKEGIWLTISATIGSFIGAAFAINLNNEVMNKIIGGLLIFMFILLIYKPENWLKPQQGEIKAKPSIIQVLVFLGIGFYGGFIQAGVGYFLLAGLVFGAGFDLLKANALKALMVSVFTLAALAVFIYNNQVDYWLGFLLGVGNMSGAWVASHVAIKKGNNFIRWFMLVTVLVFAIKLLFF